MSAWDRKPSMNIIMCTISITAHNNQLHTDILLCCVPQNSGELVRLKANAPIAPDGEFFD
jgi:hypothetical protein